MRRLGLLTALVCLLPLPAATAAGTRTVEIYLLQGEQLTPVARAVAQSQPERGALAALLAGPTARERSAAYRTALPEGTRLVRLRLSPSLVSVSLRVPERPRTPLETSLVPARAAQVTFTLRALGYPNVHLFVNGHSAATPIGVEPAFAAPTDAPELKPRAPAPADVVGVQRQLNVLRYLPKEAISGVWDYRTEQAVLALQSWAGLQRDGVVGPRTLAALNAASIPFPSVSGEARRIEVYRDRGVALLVSNGVVQRVIHVSTGAAGFATPAGTFQVYRKERLSWSVPYRVWLPLASYFFRGVALHAYREVPTRPASHGCVRVPYPEAPTVYGFAWLGTTVKVF